MEIDVEREIGTIIIVRLSAAVDAAQPASPDGIRDQVERGTYDDSKRTSFDGGSYPILRFSRVPRSIDVHVTDHPGLPFLGAGETAQGPTRAVLTNAITDATDARLRDMPLGQAKVKSAIGCAG
jgi:nicotinate dehydrogenase subunit B